MRDVYELLTDEGPASDEEGFEFSPEMESIYASFLRLLGEINVSRSAGDMNETEAGFLLDMMTSDIEEAS